MLNSIATEIENKIPNTISFFTTPEFNRLTKLSFDSKINEAAKNLETETEVKSLLDLGDKDREKMKERLSTFGSSYFIGKSYFCNDGSQNH